MERILDAYNNLANKVLENKDLVNNHYHFMMTILLFFNEHNLIASHEIYDYLFQALLKELYDGSYGPFELIGDYYRDSRENGINHEIIWELKQIKDRMENPTDLGESIANIKELCNINRIGWIMRGVSETHYETDAEHSIQMFALASLYLNLFDNSLDKLKVYEMILIHEIGEIAVGDIAELSESHKNKHEKEKQAVCQFFDNLKCGEKLIKLWLEFEDRNSEEAKFVYELDKLDPVLKAKTLDSLLNREDLFKDFYEYEENRNTFDNSKVKELFLISKKG